MLLVQKYLREHTFAQLAEEYGVKASFYDKGYKWSLNYDQRFSVESDLLSQQCRGLILATHDGRSLKPQAKMVDDRLRYDDICPGETVVLAYPMDRFFNQGQGAAADVNFNDPHLRVMEKMDGCFDYDALLNCWDGSSISIGKVVKNKLSPILVGEDNNGNLIPCKITNWFDNGKKNNWLEIITDLKFHSQNRKFKVTSNHSLNINGKFIPAFSAKVGDFMTSYCDDICDWTKLFIRSSLLGDGSLSKNGKNYKFQEAHKIDHREYSNYIQEWLGENCSYVDEQISGYGSKMLRVTSKPLSGISELRKEWYINGKKCIPKDLSWLTDFSVAKWYMDDGSLLHNKKQKERAHFATNGFSEGDVNRLANKLQEMYGVSCCAYFSKGWNIIINSGRKNEINVFWKAISPHIVDCMLYKLPESFRQRQYKPAISGKIIKTPLKTKIISIRKIEITHNNRKEFVHGRKGFDIETTSHNYFINKVLVHNSLTILYFDRFVDEWHVATRAVPEANLEIDGGFYTFRTLFEKALNDMAGLDFSNFVSELDKRFTYCFELTSPFNRVVVNYHDTRLTFLAARDVESLDELNITAMDTPGVPKVKVYSISNVHGLADWVAEQNPMGHEGVVVMDSKFRRIKVKNPAYVAFNKARDALGTSERNCLELVLAGKEDDVIPALPPEIVDRILKIKKGIVDAIRYYDNTYNYLKDKADVLNKGDKKTFALLVKDTKIWSAPMFAMFDGKVNGMNGFIEINRKEGTWSNGFLDKLLAISKNDDI